MMQYRLPLLLALAAGLAFAVPALPAHAQDMLELKLATADVDYNPTTDSVLKLASRLGLYEKHGVKVEIVVPQRSDQILAGNAGRAYYAELLEYGALIHLHTDGLLHAKTMTIDDAMCFFGSSNFDIRSFFLNFELNLLLYEREATASLRFVQSQYLNDSEHVQLEDWRTRPKWRKLTQNAAMLLSPLL